MEFYKVTLFLICRVVSDEQRSLALGVQSAIFRLVGTIPGPLVFGALFDSSCLLWQDECGCRGNCWIYDNDGLSRNALSLALPGVVVSAVCFFMSWLLYPKSNLKRTWAQKFKLSKTLKAILQSLIVKNHLLILTSIRKLFLSKLLIQQVVDVGLFSE